MTLASIGSIPTKWSWSYTQGAAGLIADVAYDLWLSTDASCGNAVYCSSYEIMVTRTPSVQPSRGKADLRSQVWLSGRGGCVPAGSYVKTVTIDGSSWQIWTGAVQTWNIVAPFVAFHLRMGH